jgi:hypothetical protein
MAGEETMPRVSDALANVVENLACRVARKTGGRVNPGQLLPYVAMSLGLITECLDGMVNEEAVFRDDVDGEVGYLFSAYEGEPESGPLRFECCVSCAGALASSARVLCKACEETVNRDLKHLAQTTGWPARAGYEHELSYLAASGESPVRAEDLAARSHYTLRAVRARLKALTVQGYIRQHLDAETGAITYRFPATDYGRDQWERNRRQIRSFPASLAEEMELKTVRIAVALGVLFLVLFVLALMRVPFPMLIAGFVLAAPVIVVRILRHRDRVADD